MSLTERELTLVARVQRSPNEAAVSILEQTFEDLVPDHSPPKPFDELTDEYYL